MEPKILVLTRSFGAGDGRSSGALQKAHLKGCDIRYETLSEIKRINDADALIVGTDTIDASILPLFPRLKAVIKFGVGVDNINIADCSEKGVYVARLSAGINSTAVAEFAFSLMLASARKIATYDRSIAGKNWR